MSQTEQTRESLSDVPAARQAPSATRVDAAHVRASELASGELATAEAGVWGSVWPVPEMSAAATIQQVRSQAGQLAAHLQRHQATVDHREAELNARLAAMENQIRGARLWLGERHAELSQQKADLDRKEQEVAVREAALTGGPKGRRGKPAGGGQATTQETDYAERTAELARREAELDAMAARLAEQLAAAEQVQDARHALRALETRRQRMDREEELLAGEQSQLELQRRQLVAERIHFADAVQADRQKSAEEQRRAIAEHDKMRRELQRQADDLTARQAALERMRGEVARGQQEALEIREAAEELWARLCGTMAPASLTESLARIRSKLADQQRLARDELAQQKAEVQALTARLTEQHAKLAQQREDQQDWLSERQKELERQAALLVAGHRRIEEERAAFEEKSGAWQSERFRLQAEIRRLLRQLNPAQDAAA